MLSSLSKTFNLDFIKRNTSFCEYIASLCMLLSRLQDKNNKYNLSKQIHGERIIHPV